MEEWARLDWAIRNRRSRPVLPQVRPDLPIRGASSSAGAEPASPPAPATAGAALLTEGDADDVITLLGQHSAKEVKRKWKRAHDVFVHVDDVDFPLARWQWVSFRLSEWNGRVKAVDIRLVAESTSHAAAAAAAAPPLETPPVTVPRFATAVAPPIIHHGLDAPLAYVYGAGAYHQYRHHPHHHHHHPHGIVHAHHHNHLRT